MIIVSATAKDFHHRDTESTEKNLNFLGVLGASVVDLVANGPNDDQHQQFFFSWFGGWLQHPPSRPPPPPIFAVAALPE